MKGVKVSRSLLEETLQSSAKSGVVVGTGDCIYHLAYTPPTSVDTNQLLFDTLSVKLSNTSTYADWVVEHFKQVSKMLVGGLRVLGLFTTGEVDSIYDSKQTAQQKDVLQLLTKINKHIKANTLIHLHFSSVQSVCRELNFESLKTTTLHLVLEDLVPLQKVAALVPVFIQTQETQVGEQVHHLISELSKSFMKSFILVDKSQSRAKIYLKHPSQTQTPKIRLKGYIQVCSVFTATTDEKQIAEDLKQDFVSNLKTRKEFLFQTTQSFGATTLFPRRVLLEGHKGVTFSDILFEDETTQNSLERASELLSFTPLEVWEHEKPIPKPTTSKKPPWFVVPLLVLLTALLVGVLSKLLT